MNLSDNSMAKNISINSLDNFRSIRSIFRSYLPTKESILIRFNEIVKPVSQTDLDLNELCKATIDTGYRVLTVENKEILKIPFVFKFKSKDLKPLFTYNAKHVRSSVIKSVLLDGEGDINNRVNRALYILYYFWFCNKNTIKDITLNVCVDLENLISTLIDKGFTLYKDYTITNDLVTKLREKLMSEKLINMSDI